MSNTHESSIFFTKSFLICADIIQSSFKVSSEHVNRIFIGQTTKNLKSWLSEHACSVMHNLTGWHIGCHLAGLSCSIQVEVIVCSTDAPSESCMGEEQGICKGLPEATNGCD